MNRESLHVKPATGIFYGVMSIFGLVFLLMVPIATKPGPSGQGWWTQPAFMPRLSLILVALTATYLFYRHISILRVNHATHSNRQTVVTELLQWVKPIEFFVYYIGYIWMLSLIGYFLSSLIFILVLCWRVGLRSKKWMLIAFLFAIALMALFRWGLGVWVPQADLYGLFPKEIRIFLMNNF